MKKAQDTVETDPLDGGTISIRVGQGDVALLDEVADLGFFKNLGGS